MFNSANIPENLKQYLPGDFQTKNPSTPIRNNFLMQNRFLFLINRCPTVTYYLQRVNLPSISLGVSSQSNPTGIDIRLPGNRYIFEDLQVSFPVDEDMKNYREIFDWIKAIAPWTNNKEALVQQKKTSDATLMIFNNAYKPIMIYKYYNIFPSFVSGLDFDITLNDVEPLIASVVFTFTHFDVLEDFTD
jgi:hypothetical protein